MRKRSASRFCPRTRLFTDPFSGLQLFLYVQASEFACLPDRSYRGKFPCRAAEAFTSEPNVHRCLCTHRIYYPPDNRQLAERGLTPRKIHSIVDCSSHCWGAVHSISFALLSFPFLAKAHKGKHRTNRPLYAWENAPRLPAQGSHSSPHLKNLSPWRDRILALSTRAGILSHGKCIPRVNRCPAAWKSEKTWRDILRNLH